MAISFICFAPRTRLLAETPPEVDRSLSTTDKPRESAANVTLADSVGLLGEELRQLAIEMQRVDELVEEKMPRDPAIREIAHRLAARSANLLERQQRLAALSKQLNKKEGIRK